MLSARQHIRVTQIGEYIRYRSCDRRFKLEHNNRELPKQLPFAERLFNVIDPVLQESGRRREEEWEDQLREAGIADVTEFRSKPATLSDNEKATSWSEFASRLDALGLTPGEEAYGREVGVGGTIGVFDVEGRIDFIVLRWRDGRPVLLLVESKASRRDRTYHRMQVATYQLLVQQTLNTSPLTVAGIVVRPDDVECVVARIDESTDLIQAILDLEPLDLDTERADIERLLAPGGAIEYIVNTPLPSLSYQLNEKCDGCVFDVHCFPETARERRLELLGIEPVAARVLRAEGVSNLDDLVGLDLSGPAAGRIRSVPSFTDNLERLQALASSRSSTLPGGSADPEAHEVEALPHSGQSQLPEHTINGNRLVRIYLSVAYDYVENRIGALSAHITKSDGMLHTGFVERDGRPQPDAIVRERRDTGHQDAAGHTIYDLAPLQGQDVIEFKASEWTGRYDEDTGAEREMLQGFLRKLIEAIAEVAEEPEAPIHFYVWSRSEIAQLVEACSRVGSGMLSHLRELLGCRESLEQLIYSCLQSEIDRRYALGWTSRGLAVATSLRWYGRVYHWRRRIGGVEDYLDRAFTQDIFDFKTTLDVKGDGTWARTPAERVAAPRFEIHSRFYDSLSAPYWRAYWRELDPTTPGLPRSVRASITRYNEVAKPGYFKEYLRARVHALRWLEEGIRFKNTEIEKPLINIGELQAFTLGVNDTARAAVDFLRLDRHVSVTDWIASHLVPPATRVPTGRTIPLGEVVAHGNNRLTATIDLTGYDIDHQTLEARCTIGEGSFVRLTPCFSDPHQGQTFNQLTRAGSTCVVDMINWQTQQVSLTVRPYNYSDRYILQSFSYNDPTVSFSRATLDESPSDFVAGRVDDRLSSAVGRSASACSWLDPTDPNVPPQAPLTAADATRYRSILEAPLLLGGRFLAPDQANAAFDGLESRIQLLQGPPGTGKTTTSAVATLLRILARRSVGDIVLISAHTHTAIDNLLTRISELLPLFRTHATGVGAHLPPVKLTKVISSANNPQPGGGIESFLAQPSARFVSRARKGAVLVVGGTTSAVLKMAKELGGRRPFVSDPERFKVPALIIDEASMMVFPHFLALATLVRGDGEIMLTGDHRQLSPIVAHDWEREDRPPVQLYQPFVSAYESVLRIKRDAAVPIPDSSVRSSCLTFTFRLPPIIRELIRRLYQLDNINLDGPVATALPAATIGEAATWHDVWDDAGGLYLVLHSERESKQSNETEIEIIEHILDAGGAQPDGSIAIVTPHRAQRSLLRTRLDAYSGPVDVIDTVERLQGGEKPTVIVSATASDPAAISAHAEFILNLNRSNVAFTRTQRRLIVVCAETLLDHIPAEIESYESTMLWKSLRAICTRQIAVEQIGGHMVRILTPPISHSSTGHAAEVL